MERSRNNIFVALITLPKLDDAVLISSFSHGSFFSFFSFSFFLFSLFRDNEKQQEEDEPLPTV